MTAVRKMLSCADRRVTSRCKTKQAQSPLLRLPAELRLAIYEYVLDVGMIHVHYRRFVHKSYKIASGSKNDESQRGLNCAIFERGTNLDGLWNRYGQDRWTHDLKLEQNQRGMTLLNPVCRQLYQETALLPYKLNLWSCHNESVYDRILIKDSKLP
jgi:hypothetical protein